MKAKPIGRAKRAIKEGETIATIILPTGEVTSDNITFLPHGKTNLKNKVFRFGMKRI